MPLRSVAGCMHSPSAARPGNSSAPGQRGGSTSVPGPPQQDLFPVVKPGAGSQGVEAMNALADTHPFCDVDI